MKISRNYIPLLLGAIFLLGSPAHSAIDVWIEGDTVSFHYDSALTGLFGDPTVIGDILFFTPTEFTAIALNESGTVLTNETFNIEVMGLGGANISAVHLTEKGDYLLHSPTGGNPFVVATGQLRALNRNDPTMDLTDSLVATGNFPETGLSAKDWDVSANLELAAWGTDNVVLTLQNLLFAGAFDIGDIAFIEKKQVVLSITTIPIQAAGWLFGSALIGLLVIAPTRRNRSLN